MQEFVTVQPVMLLTRLAGYRMFFDGDEAGRQNNTTVVF